MWTDRNKSNEVVMQAVLLWGTLLEVGERNSYGAGTEAVTEASWI
jgi:hypothetical protein